MILIRIDNAWMTTRRSLVGAPLLICALALSGCGVGQQSNITGGLHVAHIDTIAKFDQAGNINIEPLG